jgi:dTDP-4-dehydrorhamnose reductase
MPKDILVTGKTGQLGQSIQQLTAQYPLYRFTFAGRDELDLSSPQSITEYFTDRVFDVIINCAAHTAVDKAESEPELANQINHLAVKQLADIAKAHNSTLIHISTDYVFNGQNYKPYVETDSVDPRGVYGLTKLKGEQAFQTINPHGCIIRTSWVYSEFGNNFVKTMMKLGAERDQLGIIFDQVGSPTYAGDLAKAILEMLSSDQLTNGADKGTIQNAIYHFSNEGVCSWYDFAKSIFSISNIHCNISPIETKEYPTPAKRPHYSLLNKAKIKSEFGLIIPYWQDSLQTCIQILQDRTE